jgi:hypothetical protein
MDMHLPHPVDSRKFDTWSIGGMRTSGMRDVIWYMKWNRDHLAALIPQVTPEEAMFIEGKIEAWNIAIGALIAVVGDDDDQ